MANPLHALIKNRVTVSFVLLLSFMFIILPGVMVLNWITNPNSSSGELTPTSLIIILTYLFFVLSWHIGSSFLKAKLIKKEIITDHDFIDDYENGFEVLADANTLGTAKFIGHDRLKILFACNAIAVVVFMFLAVSISFLKLELLVSILESNLFFPLCIATYISIIALSYRTVERKLK